MTVEEILERIIAVSAKLNVTTYLFGSVAAGKQHKTSDIDIAVSCRNEKLFEAFSAEVSDIETLRKIDIVDLGQAGLSKTLTEEIFKNGKCLYTEV